MFLWRIAPPQAIAVDEGSLHLGNSSSHRCRLCRFSTSMIWASVAVVKLKTSRDLTPLTHDLAEVKVG
jgi:hypothetical protein